MVQPGDKHIKGYREDICPWHRIKAAATLVREDIGEFVARACAGRVDAVLNGPEMGRDDYAEKKTQA